MSVPSTPTLSLPKNRNNWSASDIRIIKGLITNEAKTRERVSNGELCRYIEGKSTQAIAAKHRALATKMYESGEITFDVSSLPSENGWFFINFLFFFLNIFSEVRKAKKSLKQDRTKLFNKQLLGLETEDEDDIEEPPLKKPKRNEEEDNAHLESSYFETENATSSAPLPEYSFTKGKIFYCFWWNVGQKDFKCHFTESIVHISFMLPKLTTNDLEVILGHETSMNLGTSHEVKWKYVLPPQTKLELSKDSLKKIETEHFFGFCGKIVHVLPELTI